MVWAGTGGGLLWNGRFEGKALHMGRGEGNYGAPRTYQRCAGCRAVAQSRDSPAGGGPGAGALLRSACRPRWARAMILARMRSPFRTLSSCWGVYTGDGSLGESLRLGEFPRWPVCCRASLAVRPGRFFFLLASVISPVRGGLFRAAVFHWLYPAGPPAAAGAPVTASVEAGVGVAVDHLAPLLRIGMGTGGPRPRP